jgi:NitT/TauT family transport system substrate-binding protein
MTISYFHRSALALTAAGLVLGVAACSSSGEGTVSGSASAAAASGVPSAAVGAPEKPDITVGVLPSADSVTVQIAQDQGLFRQEGLTVKVVTEKTTNDGAGGLLSHTMDFTSENYVGMFSQEKSVPGLNLRIVADNSQASPDGYVLMVTKNSPLTSVEQLKGKKVSYPAPGFNYGAIATDIALKPYGLSTNDFTTVVLPFSAAQQALARHQVDAAFTTEPFITTMEAAAGDRVLTDLMTGPLAGAPQACWGTTASFIAKNPQTVAAFQRAMTRAAQIASASPSYVRQELPRFIPTMKPGIADVITLPTFNTTLSLTRMQRVANVMEIVGALPANFNVREMYYPLEGPAS